MQRESINRAINPLERWQSVCFVRKKSEGQRIDDPVITVCWACTKVNDSLKMEKELDISVNLSSFFLKSIGLWITDDSTDERRRKGMLAYTVWCTFFSTVITGRDLYFTWIYNGVRVYYICMKPLTVTVSVYELVLEKMRSSKLILTQLFPFDFLLYFI